MDDYIKVLLLVGSRLEQAGIAYMLSGSTAMNFYARPRMTRDVDIVIELAAPNVAPMVHLFQADFSVDEQEIREALARQSLFNLIHYDTVVKVDCVVRKKSAYRQEEFRRRQAPLGSREPLRIAARGRAQHPGCSAKSGLGVHGALGPRPGD